MLQKIENWFFKFKVWVLSSFIILTFVMGYFAVQIKMDAGFYKQLPSNHEFVKTYYEYQGDLSGTNSITVALRLTEGNIFHGELTVQQLFSLRPAVKWADYTTPIKNYFQCGSGTHPGGGITGSPGEMAAKKILGILK
mgnify:CR=1 FL=1